MQNSDSDFYKTIISINSSNVEEKLEFLVSECLAKKIEYNDSLHHIDMAFLCDNEILLVKKDILPDNEKVFSWLADEQSIGDEPPLYFSETSHRISPLYDVLEEKKKFMYVYPEDNYKIYIMLVCNYSIINKDEMYDVWSDLDVIVIDQAYKNIEKKSTDPDDEEFERLLNEFIASEYSDENEDVSEEGCKKSLAKEKIRKIRNCRISPKDVFYVNYVEAYGIYGNGRRSASALKAINIKGLVSVYIVVELEYILNDIPKGKFCVRIYNDSGLIVSNRCIKPEYVYDASKDEYTCILAADIIPDDNTWYKGRYLVELVFDDETLNVYMFVVDTKSQKGNLYIKETEKTECPALTELNSMIGLRSVKEQMDRLKNMILMIRRRSEIGLSTTYPTMHAVFMGNPGTGKTTVAKLYGKMLKELGILSSGHVIIKTRSSLTGQNYSSEQEKTLAAINEAKGGVLFIDEAYLLYKPDDKKDPGINVLETLLSEMSANSNDWVLLMAGYTEEMLTMLSANAGFDSRIPKSNRFVFEDYSVDELMDIAGKYCNDNNYYMTTEAETALRNKVVSDLKGKDRTFGNGRYILEILTNNILQNMSVRLGKIDNPSFVQLMKIEREDIPAIKILDNPFDRLHGMIGLKNLKMELERHLNMVRMMKKRNEMGILSNIPPLHMAFLGNPGTGKTTVADLIGEIYASLGILSIGKVVCVERKDLVGQYIGETERIVSEVLKKAKGNVLFIDEAYTLCHSENPNDFGRIAIDSLLTSLSKDNIDMLVILAGYTEEMEKLLDSNVGLRSRIPYKFYFEDYTVDELIEIGKKVAKDNKFRFTSSALKALKEYVGEMMENRTENWGNGRFISRLITNEIIPNMSFRLQGLPPEKLNNVRTLTTICKSDIPVFNNMNSDGRRCISLDEKAISEILSDLDNMIGLDGIKDNIRDFVKVVRKLHNSGKSYAEMFSLRWNFVGNTGTGKSSVAEIMGRLLKALGILDKGNVVEVKLEEIYNVSEHKADIILKNAVMKSINGVLFIDCDSPIFKKSECMFDSNRILYKLSSMLVELSGYNAIIIAENEKHNVLQAVSHSLIFPDYTDVELLLILRQCLGRHNLCLSEDASEILLDYIKWLCTRRELGYANARTMKLISDNIAEKFLAKENRTDNIVLLSDVEHFLCNSNYKEKRIGFFL